MTNRSFLLKVGGGGYMYGMEVDDGTWVGTLGVASFRYRMGNERVGKTLDTFVACVQKIGRERPVGILFL